jgi:hypothetical protein
VTLLFVIRVTCQVKCDSSQKLWEVDADELLAKSGCQAEECFLYLTAVTNDDQHASYFVQYL